MTQHVRQGHRAASAFCACESPSLPLARHPRYGDAMQNLLIVMLGGAFGSGARHLTGRVMLGWLGPNWPWGTLTVNIVGGLLMGLLVGTLARFSTGGGESWRLLLGVGVLGGYTTFSSFSLEVVTMIERGLWAGALSYVLLSLCGAVLALFGGLFAVRVLA